MLSCLLSAFLVSTEAGQIEMTPKQASAFANLALKGLTREYPNKPGDVLTAEADVRPTKAIHPAFYGSYDWHSSVHGHWMLVRLLRKFPDLPERDAMRAVLRKHLTAKNIKAEIVTFERKEMKSFERPYGWAWLLNLATELDRWDDPEANEWSRNLSPLATLIEDRYVDFFPKQTYPIRSGVHSQTAFGLSFAYDRAVATKDVALRQVVVKQAKKYYGGDVDLPARWEPDGADFFSPSLMEADLMRRVLPENEFKTWLDRALPGLAKGEPKSLLTPATVTDRTDPQIVHLDGLNLSRAWCMVHIAAALPKDDPAGRQLREAADRHARAGLENVASGDYAGEHWLASFAVYLLTSK